MFRPIGTGNPGRLHQPDCHNIVAMVVTGAGKAKPNLMGGHNPASKFAFGRLSVHQGLSKALYPPCPTQTLMFPSPWAGSARANRAAAGRDLRWEHVG